MPLMIDALKKDGQPPETAWPYSTQLLAAASWFPPPDCNPIFRRELVADAADVTTIISHLKSGKAVLIATEITEQFYAPPANNVVVAKNPDRHVGTHALVAVGCGQAEGENLILVRNSWGDGWGERGCAWLSQEYLATRLTHVVVAQN